MKRRGFIGLVGSLVAGLIPIGKRVWPKEKNPTFVQFVDGKAAIPVSRYPFEWGESNFTKKRRADFSAKMQGINERLKARTANLTPAEYHGPIAHHPWNHNWDGLKAERLKQNFYRLGVHSAERLD